MCDQHHIWSYHLLSRSMNREMNTLPLHNIYMNKKYKFFNPLLFSKPYVQPYLRTSVYLAVITTNKEIKATIVGVWFIE